MLGLLGSLDLGARSLQTQQLGVEVAGHNLANVNNPAYSRQRVRLETAPAVAGPAGPQGTGCQAAGIQQLRDFFLDRQVAAEASVTGDLQAQQQALQQAQTALGQVLDGTQQAGDAAAGSSFGIAEGLTGLLNSFQSLSADPTSLTQRQGVLQDAQALADQFNQTDQRLDALRGGLNDSVQADVGQINQLLADVAQLNQQVASVENGSDGSANDLRDLRQSKLEELSKLVKVQAGAGPNGAVNLAIAGVEMVSGDQLSNTLEAYDAGGGQWLVREQAGGTQVSPAGGHLAGTIGARDGVVAALRSQLDTLASELITQVNTLHGAGFSLTGTTGEAFFTGTGAATIQVNQRLLDNPALLQASGTAGAAADNQVALALAQLKDQKLANLNGQTLGQSYGLAVAQLGHALASVNNQVDTQKVLGDLLESQRQAVSGVSLDEEMTDLMKYQKAYQASARLITTVNDMLQTLLTM